MKPLRPKIATLEPLRASAPVEGIGIVCAALALACLVVAIEIARIW